MLKKLLKKIYFLLNILSSSQNYFEICKSQNDNQENLFLISLIDSVKNKYFVEIGFHHTEFNTPGLIENNFEGHLIDGGRKINIFLMKLIIFILKKKIKVSNTLVTTKNVINIIKKKKIAYLSIDIDGNDYWILKKIIEFGILPEVIITEYNPSFLHYTVSIPYEENFDRLKKHKSGFYHGASLSAFAKLLNKYNYSLIKCIGGTNAIFVNDSIKNKKKITAYSSKEIYQEGRLRNYWSKTDAKSQFDQIKHLPLVGI